MSDVTPNYELERQGLELERSQLLLNIQSQKYRVAQLHDEAARIQVNIEATETSIALLDKQLKIKEQ